MKNLRLTIALILMLPAAAALRATEPGEAPQPRGVAEILFSMPYTQPDTLSLPMEFYLTIFDGYVPPHKPDLLPEPLRPVLSNTITERPERPLRGSRGLNELKRRLAAEYLMSHPQHVTYLAWTLPEPPRLLPADDNTDEFLIADVAVDTEAEPVPVQLDDVKRANWLHKTDASLQFSQAYLSPNWYQGGSNNLSLLINLLWDVRLNEVYHPSLLFESTLSYKLGLYSTPQDSVHNYSVSEDLLQYNMKFGVRARNKWFYSLTTQFKTQLLNNYGENSKVRKAAFMSPGELNFGLGMTYSTTGRKGKLKFNMSLAPISYNLKTCLDSRVDPTQFSIKAGRKSQSQVGSNAEATLQWSITSNISWRSRMFLFTNYDDFQGDWENTFNFAVNRFLSTQIYAHLRYDTTSETSRKSWRHWMFKEILSFGFRYTFSTK